MKKKFRDRRYLTKTKDERFLTYAVWDTHTDNWVEGTESTVLEHVGERCHNLELEHNPNFEKATQ